MCTRRWIFIAFAALWIVVFSLIDHKIEFSSVSAQTSASSPAPCCPSFPLNLRLLQSGVGGPVKRLAVAGNYAYVYVVGAGLNVLDLSATITPTVAASIYPSFLFGEDQWLGGVEDLATHDHYLYVASGSPGLMIFDISNPLAPQKIGVFQPGGYINRVEAAGNFVYLVDSGVSPNLLRVVDVANPATPQEVSSLAISPEAVVVAGNYGYVASGPYGLHVLDLSDPSAPQDVAIYPEIDIHTSYQMVMLNNYLYTINPADVTVLDVSNPAASQMVGSLDLPGKATCITAAGDKLYVGGEFLGPPTASYLWVVDVSNPAAPILQTTTQTGGWCIDSAVVGTRLVLVNGDLQVFDITDPAAPQPVARLGRPWSIRHLQVAADRVYVLDHGGLRVLDITQRVEPQELGLLTTPEDTHTFVLDGQYAYIADGRNGLRIADVANPAPREVAVLPTPGTATGVAKTGNEVYLVDGNLHVVNVADPFAPQEASVLDLPGVALDVAASGHYAYVAAGEAGLRTVDVTNPAQPQEVGFFETTGSAFQIQVAGQHVFLNDTVDGVLIIDIANPAAPRQVAALGPANAYQIVGAYVYLCASTVQVLNIVNPAMPFPVASIEMSCNDVAVADKYYLYTADNFGLNILKFAAQEAYLPIFFNRG